MRQDLSSSKHPSDLADEYIKTEPLTKSNAYHNTAIELSLGTVKDFKAIYQNSKSMD